MYILYILISIDLDLGARVILRRATLRRVKPLRNFRHGAPPALRYLGGFAPVALASRRSGELIPESIILSKPGGGNVTDRESNPRPLGCISGDSTTRLKRSGLTPFGGPRLRVSAKARGRWFTRPYSHSAQRRATKKHAGPPPPGTPNRRLGLGLPSCVTYNVGLWRGVAWLSSSAMNKMERAIIF